MTTLRGITWAHSRGYVPLVAASEAWHDLHPGTEVIWEKRSLWGFGEGPLDEVAREFDLIVFDHPHTGDAAERGLLMPLDELAAALPPFAGPSRESYEYRERLYGLPVDGSCQAAAYRPDRLAGAGFSPPSSWEEVLNLAKETGQVRCSFTPMGVMGMFHSICAGVGARAGRSAIRYVDEEAAATALGQLRALFSVCGSQSLEQSPVRILGSMASAGECLYAPLLYGYSNYCRTGYCTHPLAFAPPPTGEGATLGGAGLGVSAFTRHREQAFHFAAWLVSPDCQQGLYFAAQGQPALRRVWESDSANEATGSFFRRLLPAMETAYVRPNYPGYGRFQSLAGALLHSFLRHGKRGSDVLHEMELLYAASRPEVSS